METLALSDAMMKEFKKGCLAPLREVVCTDDTLVMRFWGRKVEVDYRGQVLINVWQIGTKYSIYTMPFFNRYMDPAEGDTMDRILNLIPHYKNVTDDLLWEDPEMEGERRQLVERMNNRSGRVSKSSDYDIAGVAYMGIKPNEHKNAPIDIMALRDFTSTDEGNTVASLSVMQICPDRPKPLPDKDFYQSGDLSTQLKILFERTKLIDKIEQTIKCVQNQDWLEDARENLRKVFQQKCELGLIDSQGIEGEFDIDVSHPEIALLIFDQSPKLVGTQSLLRTISLLDPENRIRVVSGAPMGLAIYDDYMKSLDEYLKNIPVPNCRIQEIRGLDDEDFDRLLFAECLLESLQAALEGDGQLNWDDIRKALQRVVGFLWACAIHETQIAQTLEQTSDEPAVVQVAKGAEQLSMAATKLKEILPELTGTDPGPSGREMIGQAVNAVVNYVGESIAIYEALSPRADDADSLETVETAE